MTYNVYLYTYIQWARCGHKEYIPKNVVFKEPIIAAPSIIPLLPRRRWWNPRRVLYVCAGFLQQQQFYYRSVVVAAESSLFLWHFLYPLSLFSAPSESFLLNSAPFSLRPNGLTFCFIYEYITIIIAIIIIYLLSTLFLSTQHRSRRCWRFRWFFLRQD